MSKTLADELRPASFRKIPFLVDSSTFEAGRRVQLHEYPMSDKPYAQDMGRATRRISFDALVVGKDYIEKTNALLGAIEEPGAGELIHPWFGAVKVNLLSCRVNFDRGLGRAVISLDFIEAGELSFPSSKQSTQALSKIAAAGLEGASTNFFSQAVAFAKTANTVISQGLITYGKVLGFMSNPAFALSSLLDFGSLPGNLSSLGALMSIPLDLGWNFASLLNVSSIAKKGDITKDDKTLIPVVRGLTRMVISQELAAQTSQAFTTITSKQIANNTNAILAHTRQLLLVQVVGLTSYLKCTIYDDTISAVNEIVKAIDGEMLIVEDDDLFNALLVARAAVFNDLLLRSTNSARIVIVMPPDTIPALALAYDFYEDAGRDLEIVERNNIKNPCFVNAKPLYVVSV